MSSVLGHLRGALAVTLLVGLTLAWGIPLLPASIAKLSLPAGRARHWASNAVLGIAKNWARGSNAIILGISGTRLAYQQLMADDPNGRYVLISNHQCWADVMLLIAAIDPKLPFPRYFIKEPLRWLPVVGLAAWALDFPFMKRHSRAELDKHPERRHEDIQAVQRACAVFRDVPVSLVNYAEGTRATPAKRAATHSPYRTLLPPKAGGTAFAVNAMSGVLDGILDMSVAYVDTPDPTFWNLLCGRIDQVAIRVRYLRIPADLERGDYGSDSAYRQRFKEWLNAVWATKDADVTALQDPANPARSFADRPNPDAAGHE